MRISLVVFLLTAAALAAAQQDPTPQTPPKPAPIPTGVVPLPKGSPPTGQQAPIPAPLRKLPAGDQPIGWKPDLDAIRKFTADQPITMDQAVSIALYANRSFSTAVASLQVASARTGEARSSLFPTLGVNEDLTYYDKATTVSTAAFGGGGTTTTTSAPPLVVLPQFNPIFTAALNLPIDLFGSLRSAVSQAQFNEVAARINVNRVRNDVIYNTKNAFYAVLRGTAQVAVATDSLNNAMARLNDANKNYGAGTSSRFDITTAQRDVADAQQNLIAAKATVSTNLGILKNTLGIEVSARLSVKNDGAVEYPPGVEAPYVTRLGEDGKPLADPNGVKTDPESTEVPHPVPSLVNPDQPSVKDIHESLDPTASAVTKDDFDFGPEYETLLREALSNRPEILEADAQIEAGHKGLQYAQRSTLPSLTIGLEDIYTANSTPLERKNQEAIMVGISVPIFDGGLAHARAEEQRGTIAQAEVSKRQAKGQVLLDVQAAYIALVQSRQRVAVANVEVSAARESFRVSRVRYLAGVSGQTGVSPQLELSNAQISLAQAESNLVNALYDYNGARAQLDRATGRYGFSGVGPGYTSKFKIPH